MTERPDERPDHDDRDSMPRGREDGLARLLENWLERIEESIERDDALGIAASAGFLRRTRPRLLADERWDAVRDRVERLLATERFDRASDAALREQIGRSGANAAARLGEFAMLARAESRQRRRTRAVSEERDEAVTLAESIDRVLLATACLSRDRDAATPLADDPLRAAAADLATRAALSGECFRTIRGWFAAMCRSVDGAYRPTAHAWRGEGLRPFDQLLLASGAWLQTTSARIRLEREEASDLARETRLRERADSIERRLQFLEETCADNLERWRMASRDAERPDALPLDSLATRSAATEGLLHALLSGARPRLAAASAAPSAAAATILEWAGGEDRLATCLLQPTALATNLRVEFFERDGALSRALDGMTVSWLGTAATIADGRADFATDRLRSTASPLDVLRRSAVLFVGDTPWRGSFGLEAGGGETDPESGFDAGFGRLDDGDPV